MTLFVIDLCHLSNTSTFSPLKLGCLFAIPRRRDDRSSRRMWRPCCK